MGLRKVVNIIMERDNLSFDDAKEDVLECRRAMLEALDSGEDDPEEILAELLGLEPDYIFDLI